MNSFADNSFKPALTLRFIFLEYYLLNETSALIISATTSRLVSAIKAVVIHV